MGFGITHMWSQRSSEGKAHRGLLIALLVLVLACGAGGFELYREGHAIKSQSADILTSMKTLSNQMTTGDFEGVATTSAKIEKQAAQARSTVEGPLWQIASQLPVIGEDVKNVRALVDALSDISEKGIGPVAQQAKSGNVPSLGEAYAQLDAEIEKAKKTVDELSRGSNDEVNNAVARAKEYLERVPDFSEVGATKESGKRSCDLDK
ncbi:hypothetical protein [Atopobium sp. oral taxon 810]|uniref:hypothetical protein n=1 Tax=Atopobium sp. oral taxon 810 TaxID=712158 RepID=UPI00042A2570|nr:hypothetical protein [Atopobium sp. oral taxon 810]